MEENLKIFYILIGSESKPLAGYGQCKAEFIQVCENQLKNCKANNSACVTHTDYKIYYQNEDNITYLIMTSPSYLKHTAVACVEGLRKEFGAELIGRDLKGMEDYGLNSELKKKLKAKNDYYTENTDVLDEKIEELKKAMVKFEAEIKIAKDEMNKK